ncbi:MAG: mocA [Ignavibacteria bacterium]|nr:mocA [Ignavibacteria bacterium]
MIETDDETCPGAIILAAGLSERMQSPKPLLKFDSQKRFIDKIFDEYLKFGCNEVIVVINHALTGQFESIRGIKFAVNTNPEKGRFSSIKIGVEFLESSNFCFIQNIDNPFVNQDVLRILNQVKEQSDYIVPTFEGRGGHPILLNKNIIDNIKKCEKDDLNLRELLAKYKSKKVEFNDNSILININTKEEYNYYFHF